MRRAADDELADGRRGANGLIFGHHLFLSAFLLFNARTRSAKRQRGRQTNFWHSLIRYFRGVSPPKLLSLLHVYRRDDDVFS